MSWFSSKLVDSILGSLSTVFATFKPQEELQSEKARRKKLKNDRLVEKVETKNLRSDIKQVKLGAKLQKRKDKPLKK